MGCECKSINVKLNGAEHFFQFCTTSNFGCCATVPGEWHACFICFQTSHLLPQLQLSAFQVALRCLVFLFCCEAQSLALLALLCEMGGCEPVCHFYFEQRWESSEQCTRKGGSGVMCKPCCNAPQGASSVADANAGRQTVSHSRQFNCFHISHQNNSIISTWHHEPPCK